MVTRSPDERTLARWVRAHNRWRGREVFNLLPSENALSATAKRYLASDLAGRYTLPISTTFHGEAIDNSYAGTRYTDRIEELGNRVAVALDQGAFEAPAIDGSISIAGGTLRIPNLAAATPSAKLFGSASLKLADLSLGGGFSLTPVGSVGEGGLVNEATARITANLTGTLEAPQRQLDIAGMVDAIKVKALEAEVARLEALKAADDARAAAVAKANTAARKEAREDAAARQLADQQAAQKAAADAAARAAAEAAAKKAAQDAAAKAAAEAAARQSAQQKPMDLGMPPGAFQ